MKVFVGVGLGPIQTGIFMSGACRGGFDRIVIAEVDDKLRNAINDNGGVVTINTAYADSIKVEVIKNVEVYNPNTPEGRARLVDAAADACELATALPSVKFFAYCAPWMVEGFRKQPDRVRFIYTAENNNRAAEELEERLCTGHAGRSGQRPICGSLSDAARRYGYDRRTVPGRR